eukprot:CAMPEP_0116879348 /NCGR_PEP_ID=MMETSP0463-20121206/11154_1 /TAXON_ID=181622 /ORGANISM="Strombidinopsis sp, Strain SopsisLIS2011" /LENGTH=49 /DNA_ID=CAMNT_0004528591 /DNA_START=1149 /DNA_END=1298 /DNA_ORIENTATION=-
MAAMDATAIANRNMTQNTGQFGQQTMMQQPMDMSVSPSNVNRMQPSPMN